MLKKIMGYLFYGIAWGCSCFVIFGAIFLLASGAQSISFSKTEYLIQAAASIFAGICCASSTIVYTFDNLSNKTKILIHTIVGLGGYFIAAYFANWIPLSNPYATIAMVLSVVIFFFAIWIGFYLFHKVEAKKINRQLKHLQSTKKS